MIIDGIKYAAKCDECGKGMREGYVIDGGVAHYCTDDCLYKNMTPADFLELYDYGDGDSYWTEWDDVDSWPDEWHDE